MLADSADADVKLIGDLHTAGSFPHQPEYLKLASGECRPMRRFLGVGRDRERLGRGPSSENLLLRMSMDSVSAPRREEEEELITGASCPRNDLDGRYGSEKVAGSIPDPQDKTPNSIASASHGVKSAVSGAEPVPEGISHFQDASRILA
jgi:hypothetical protein